MEKSCHILIAHPQAGQVLASRWEDELYLPHVFGKDLETSREVSRQIEKKLALNFELRFLGSDCLFREGDFGFRKLKLFEVLSSVPPEAPNGFSWVAREKVRAIGINPPAEDVVLYLKKYSTDGLEVMREMHESYYVLIVYPKDERVLASEVKNGLYLPRVFDEDLEVCSEVCCQIQKELSLNFELRFLRCECEVMKGTTYDVKLKIFEVLSSVPPKAPNGFSWVGRNQVCTIKVSPYVKDVARYLKNYSKDGLKVNWERLLPYSKPGWFQEASSWVRDSLSRYGCKSINSIKHTRQTSEGSILRAETENGTFYMKAVPPGSVRNELLISSSLSDVLPEYFVKPVSTEKERGWMLMEDYGPTFTFKECTVDRKPELFKNILTHWCDIQLRSVNLKGELLKAGFPEVSTAKIIEKVKVMVNDPDWFSEQDRSLEKIGWTRYGMEEYGKKYLEYVQNLCRKLEMYNVPLALVHGDLNPINIAKPSGDRYKYLDFAYTCISFPFIDAITLGSIYDEIDTNFDKLDFYLKKWIDYEPLPRLRKFLSLNDEFRGVIFEVDGYQSFLNAEESERERAREELGQPVSDVFDKSF